MDARLTDEQAAWSGVVDRFARDLASTNPDRLGADDDADAWKQLVDLGVPALRSAELSGVDIAGVEIALAVERTGAALLTVPVVGQAVLAPELLAAAGCDAALARVADGSLRLAPVLSRDLTGIARVGEPGVAFDAAGASHGLMVDRHGCECRIVAVPLDGDRLNGLDLTRKLVPVSADVSADAAEPLPGDIEPGRWTQFEALALTTLAADLLGVMDRGLADAVAYAGERHQFGTPIGRFQAVQHLLADALARVEGARSCVWHAAWAVDHAGPDDALTAARIAKAYASAAARDVVETTVQVFGGIAITWEHLSHLRLRRVLLDRQVLGTELVHYEAIAARRLADAGID